MLYKAEHLDELAFLVVVKHEVDAVMVYYFSLQPLTADPARRFHQLVTVQQAQALLVARQGQRQAVARVGARTALTHVELMVPVRQRRQLVGSHIVQLGLAVVLEVHDRYELTIDHLGYLVISQRAAFGEDDALRCSIPHFFSPLVHLDTALAGVKADDVGVAQDHELLVKRCRLIYGRHSGVQVVHSLGRVVVLVPIEIDAIMLQLAEVMV